MPDIKETLTAPLGPLPRYAWVLVIVGGYFGYKFLSGRSSSSTSTTAATVGTSAGTVAPSSSDYAALTSQVSTLGNQITDLGSKIATIGSGTTSGTTTSGTPIGTVVTAPVEQTNNIATLQDNPAIRFLDSAGGLVTPTAKYYTVKATAWIDDPNTPENTLVKAFVVSEGGRDVYLLARNVTDDTVTAAGAVSSNAVQQLGTVVPTPQFSDNTATPTPTSSAATVASGSIIAPMGEVVQAPSMPTFSNEPITANSLNIPATNPS